MAGTSVFIEMRLKNGILSLIMRNSSTYSVWSNFRALEFFWGRYQISKRQDETKPDY